MISNKETEFPSRFHGPHASPGFLLWRHFMRWQKGMNAILKPLGLTQPQFALLAVCAWMGRENKSIEQHEIVRFLEFDRMHVSQIITRLERDGLLNRKPSKTDQRSKRLCLTAKGWRLLQTALPEVEAYDAAFFAET